MIRQWADRLCDLEVDRKIVGLHVVDTVAAFLAGRSTAEGKALAGLCGPDASISEQAAMIADAQKPAALVRFTFLDSLKKLVAAEK